MWGYSPKALSCSRFYQSYIQSGEGEGSEQRARSVRLFRSSVISDFLIARNWHQFCQPKSTCCHTHRVTPESKEGHQAGLEMEKLGRVWGFPWQELMDMFSGESSPTSHILTFLSEGQGWWQSLGQVPIHLPQEIRVPWLASHMMGKSPEGKSNAVAKSRENGHWDDKGALTMVVMLGFVN